MVQPRGIIIFGKTMLYLLTDAGFMLEWGLEPMVDNAYVLWAAAFAAGRRCIC